MTIKVKWEVHSGPFKGPSQPTQGSEYNDEGCHLGQRSFVGPQSLVSELGQGQDQDQDQEGSRLGKFVVVEALENTSLVFIPVINLSN